MACPANPTRIASEQSSDRESKGLAEPEQQAQSLGPVIMTGCRCTNRNSRWWGILNRGTLLFVRLCVRCLQMYAKETQDDANTSTHSTSQEREGDQREMGEGTVANVWSESRGSRCLTLNLLASQLNIVEHQLLNRSSRRVPTVIRRPISVGRFSHFWHKVIFAIVLLWTFAFENSIPANIRGKSVRASLATKTPRIT